MGTITALVSTEYSYSTYMFHTTQWSVHTIVLVQISVNHYVLHAILFTSILVINFNIQTTTEVKGMLIISYISITSNMFISVSGAPPLIWFEFYLFHWSIIVRLQVDHERVFGYCALYQYLYLLLMHHMDEHACRVL